MLTRLYNGSNSLLVGVLIAGSLFIGATRVRPPQLWSSPPTDAVSPTTPAPLPDHPAPDFTLALW